MEGHKILDNGAAEGELLEASELIELATEVGADEIIVPDVLSDSFSTVEKASEFKHVALAHPEFKYVGVVQGQTLREQSGCLLYLKSMGYMDIYALPRVMCADNRFARAAFATGQYEKNPKIKYHCLGSSNWCEETKVLANLPMIRSMDSAMPIKMGIKGQFIVPDAWYDVEAHTADYFAWDPENLLGEWRVVPMLMKEWQGGAIDANIHTFLNWAAAPAC